MSGKCRYTPRREIIAATLLTVLSIALLAQPRLLLSQSDEQNADTPNENPFPIKMSPDTMPVGGLMIFDNEMGAMINTLIKEPIRLEEIEKVISQIFKERPLSELNGNLAVDFSMRDGKIIYDIRLPDNVSQTPGGNSYDKIVFPVLINKIEPIYPETAKAAGISGDVLLIVSVDEKGETIRVSAIDGHPELAKTAITAVSQWRYEPARSSGGESVPTTFGAIIRFLPDGTIDSEQGWTIYIEH